MDQIIGGITAMRCSLSSRPFFVQSYAKMQKYDSRNSVLLFGSDYSSKNQDYPKFIFAFNGPWLYLPAKQRPPKIYISVQVESIRNFYCFESRNSVRKSDFDSRFNNRISKGRFYKIQRKMFLKLGIYEINGKSSHN